MGVNLAPDMTVKIALDGKPMKSERINAENLFSYDNVFAIGGNELADGAHTIEVSREGSGPLYYNAYLTNFTMEDNITRAGLEIKVDRKYYKLVPVAKKIKVEGSRGQAVDQKVEKYERKLLDNLAQLKSGDLVEIELEIDSKNDYEYIVFEDMKAAGFEPVEVRSGYGGEGMHLYMEYRDEKVTNPLANWGFGTLNEGSTAKLATSTSILGSRWRARSSRMRMATTRDGDPSRTSAPASAKACCGPGLGQPQ